MAAILSTVTVLALLSATASSAPPPTSPPTTTTPPEEDTYLFVPRQIQLAAFPRPSAAFVPSEPLSVLTPPLEESPAADFYGVPVPAQELLAPTETGWNPQDDPRMYYEVVETPTRAFPKKYLAETHSKGKPYSSRPKQEVVLVEVEEEVPRKALEKKYLDEAKRRNRAELEQARQDV